MNWLEKLKYYLFPDPISTKIQNDIDWSSMRNIYQISLAVLIADLITFIFYTITSYGKDPDFNIVFSMVSIGLILCLVTFIFSRRMLADRTMNHRYVVIFKTVFFIAFSIWGIVTDYRHYIAHEQMMVFFTVQMIIACFIVFKPLMSVILVSFVYLLQYGILYVTDKAALVQPHNYFLLVLISITAMIFRFHTQLYLSTKTVALQETNQKLEYSARHDGLTGLRNRTALEEDADHLIQKPLKIRMIDINYFKEINDSLGHLAGDKILKEVAVHLRTNYPDSRIYRYGGDEFLVIHENMDHNQGPDDIYRFDYHGEKETRTILLSIGTSEGTAASRQDLFRMISKADKALYAVKKRTHTPEYGGYDRRKRATDSEDTPAAVSPLSRDENTVL